MNIDNLFKKFFIQFTTGDESCTANILALCSECGSNYSQSKKEFKTKLRKTNASRCVYCSIKRRVLKYKLISYNKRMLKDLPEWTCYLVNANDLHLLRNKDYLRLKCSHCEIIFKSRKDHIDEKFKRMKSIYCTACSRIHSAQYDKLIAVKKFKKTLKERYGIGFLSKKEVKKIYDNKYLLKNKDLIRSKRKSYYHARKEFKRQYDKTYRAVNFEKIKKHQNERLKNDLNYKMAVRLRQRINMAIKHKIKKTSAVRDLGCTIPEVISHIEKQFKAGMTWSNWSRNGWHLDHIKPLCSFNLENEIEAKAATHYTNLQPLWCRDNQSKGGRQEHTHLTPVGSSTPPIPPMTMLLTGENPALSAKSKNVTIKGNL